MSCFDRSHDTFTEKEIIKLNIEIIIIIMNFFYSFLKKSDLHRPLIGLKMHTWLLGQMRGVRKQKNVEQPW